MQPAISESGTENRTDLPFRIAIYVIIVFGIILRASKYLPGRSMRRDELAVTLNLVSRSALDLITKPLNYEQAAPVGFLFLEKSLIMTFGPSEYVLRLVAFLTGCLSLVLMFVLLKKTSGPYGTVFALMAFACSHYLIYYSAELKQYSSDVFLTLVLALLFHHHISRDTQARDFWELGVIGALAICFSHPAIFVTIPMGVTLFRHYWKERHKLLWISLIGALWAGTFLVIYLMLLRHQTTNTYLITFWGDLDSYMPLRFWRDPSWFPGSIGHLFSNIGGLAQGITFILIAFYLSGLWLFWKEGKWQWAVAASMPIALNMIVSGFEKFPFHGRLIMYLLPLVFLIFAKAIDGLLSLFKHRFPANVAFAAVVILLLNPAASTINNFLFTKAYVQDDLKPVLSYMRTTVDDTDMVYMYHYASSQFGYYAQQYGLDGLNTISGQDYSRNAKRYDQDISSLPRGERIWFLFTFVGETRVSKGEKQNEREYILNYLLQNGILIDEFYSSNRASSAHLFILK